MIDVYEDYYLKELHITNANDILVRIQEEELYLRSLQMLQNPKLTGFNTENNQIKLSHSVRRRLSQSDETLVAAKKQKP